MTERVRVKICGLTRVDDVRAAVAAGADALGFNCYSGSPRHVPLDRLRELAAATPPFVTPVLLFVNAHRAQVDAGLAAVPHALLQFHGDEEADFCASFGRPYIKAVGMADGVALLDWQGRFVDALALLADAPAAGYGGSGAAFDWTRVPGPAERRLPLVLAGGLNDGNVGDAIRATRPYAVDVSSGVEAGTKGVKDPQRMMRFIEAVRAATTD